MNACLAFLAVFAVAAPSDEPTSAVTASADEQASAVTARADELVSAVGRGDLAAVRTLVGQGADPDAPAVLTHTRRGGFLGLGKRRTYETTTSAVHEALGRALDKGDVSILTFLLANGGDPDAPTASHVPPLHRVARSVGERGAIRAAGVLLEAGADPTALFRRRTPLADLPEEADASAFVGALLDAGADADALICDASTVALVDLVRTRGPDLDAECFARPPLVRAAERGDAALLAHLLEAGADPDVVGLVEGLPVAPLHVAVGGSWVEGVEILVRHGADPDRPAGLLGVPPLHVASAGPAADALVALGARRTVQTSPAAAAWALRPPGDGEMGSFLFSWAGDETLPLPESVAPLAERRDALRARAEALGPESFARLVDALSVEETARALDVSLGACDLCALEEPSFSDLRARFGPPLVRTGTGGLLHAEWEAVRADGVRVGSSARVVEVWGEGPEGAEALIGLPREAAWLALGEPQWAGPEVDRFEGTAFAASERGVFALVLAYEEERVVAYGITAEPY